MKTKYPSMFGLLGVLVLVASLIVPANLATPEPASADAGLCRWDVLDMPGFLAGKNDIARCTEIVAFDVGNDGATAIAAVNWVPNPANLDVHNIHFFATGNNGVWWTVPAGNNLVRQARIWQPVFFVLPFDTWDVAIAPDDPNFWAVVTTGFDTVTGFPVAAPVDVWVTENAGAQWTRTQFWEAYEAANPGPGSWNDGFISAIDISPDYGGRRDIAVGVRNAGAANNANLEIWVVQTQGFAGWALQNAVLPVEAAGVCDLQDLEFSPTYVGDAALAAVFTDATSTYFNVALRDCSTGVNNINSWAYNPSVEVKDPMSAAAQSPGTGTIVSADLELPSDFSGQAASLRRAYVSLDAGSVGGASEEGIYRVDDNVVYELMDTTTIAAKRIRSIAYYGTYASGKLLAGEVLGFPCTATVPTWFTDSPTTCPIPCWYPALKPTTGAACGAGGVCVVGNQAGRGNALVEWNADGTLAFAATGCHPIVVHAAPPLEWFNQLDNAPCCDDESAWALSRNNGETWNQLGLIDTTLTKFNDVAPSADCTTLYLASVSGNATGYIGCCQFDSVWRTSANNEVTSPLPAYPIGMYYERVYCRVTAVNCTLGQTDLPLLRLAPDKTDGEIIGWAAQATQAQAWSPDFGDFWAIITPRNAIQDFAFESSTILYDLNVGGLVQKMPYTGTAWSSAEPTVNTNLSLAGGFAGAHSIAVQAEGKVLVGSDAVYNTAAYPAAITANFDASDAPFTTMLRRLPTNGNVHVAFHPDFDNNQTFYIADDSACTTCANNGDGGTVYRNTFYPGLGAALPWADVDMMSPVTGAVGCAAPHRFGQFGLQVAFDGSALYSAHAGCALGTCLPPNAETCAVCRTLDLLEGMPKPGIIWDCLDVFAHGVIPCFTLEPWSLKKCGCLTDETDTILWAIEDLNYAPATFNGMLWGFIDCLAKVGPALITEDEMLIGCDPVSGRNQEINLCWEQLCVSDAYDIEVAKNEDFSIRVLDWCADNVCAGIIPAELTTPCVYIPAGAQAETDLWVFPAGSGLAFFGNFECGHEYFWRVQVRRCATTQWIRSPWSEVRTFTIKAGLPVRADYYGIKLLAPDNGCLGCPTSPASFSWAPFKGTEKYKFILAKDAALTDVIAEAEVGTTAYEYDGTLDYSTNYFWRVMSLEPAPSDWSATFSFQTEAAPEAPPAAPEAPTTPLWVWVVIAIGAILVIVTLVLIFKTRRV